MGNNELTQVQKLYLEALIDGPKESGELTTIVRNRLTQIKSGNNPVGATGRAQAVLDELERDGYIVVVSKKLFGGKKYDITAKGKGIIG
jgi:DNA-binding PadR family transcriptional regulator